MSSPNGVFLCVGCVIDRCGMWTVVAPGDLGPVDNGMRGGACEGQSAVVGHVDVAGVRYELPDGRVLLDDVSFRVGEGALAALHNLWG